MGGSQARMSYCCGSEDGKHGPFKMLQGGGGEREKGHKSETQRDEGSKRASMFSISFSLCLF